MEKNYSVKIANASKELTPIEKIGFKDVSDTISLGEMKADESIIITPDLYLELDIHNEKSENKDYKVYIIRDKSGQRYSTSSENFWNTFTDIMEETEGMEVPIKIYCKPSKNYKGKYFLTCSVAL